MRRAVTTSLLLQLDRVGGSFTRQVAALLAQPDRRVRPVPRAAQALLEQQAQARLELRAQLAAPARQRRDPQARPDQRAPPAPRVQLVRRQVFWVRPARLVARGRLELRARPDLVRPGQPEQRATPGAQAQPALRDRVRQARQASPVALVRRDLPELRASLVAAQRELRAQPVQRALRVLALRAPLDLLAQPEARARPVQLVHLVPR